MRNIKIPLASLLVGAFAVVLAARRYRRGAGIPNVTSEPAELTPGEAARLAEILRRGEG